MPLTDLPLELLRSHRPIVAEPADFDEFWATTLGEARGYSTEHVLRPAETPVRELIIEDLTFPGFGGEPIRAWVSRPRGASGPLPTVIEYNGYGGGRGVAGEKLLWAASGYVHIFMDTRGQGSGWGTGGDTPDPHGSDPAGAGWMTKGIANPETYFYRRLFTDAVRLVDLARTLDFVDLQRIAVTGGSQGGGISLAVAGLVPEIRAVMPDVPFLCDFRRSVELAATDPFGEITRYLAIHPDREASSFATLSYFDGVNFAKRATAPSLFSVALMDATVLPSGVFAAFNHFGGQDREIEIYPYNGHEGGQTRQWIRQAGWLPGKLG